MSEDLSVTTFLKEISTRLTTAVPTARAALICAESGAEREAVRIAMTFDEVVYEVKMLHGAMVLTARDQRADDAS